MTETTFDIPPSLRAAIAEAWGWPPDASFTPVQRGENELIRVDTPAGAFACRIYRPGRWSRATIEAEQHWTQRLARHLPVPAPIATRGGEPLAPLPDGRLACAVPWVSSGRSPAIETPEEAKRLGRLLRQLRRSCDELLSDAPADWPGRRRPIHAPLPTLRRTLARLEAAPFSKPDHLARLRQASARLATLVDELALLPSAFVHFDAHRGNILDDGETWWLIDFDDSGFAPPEAELAAIRTHLRAAGRAEALFPALLAGWGPHDPRRVATAAAVHVVHMLGEFPTHLDIASIARDPGGLVERYLGFLDAEMSEALGTH